MVRLVFSAWRVFGLRQRDVPTPRVLICVFYSSLGNLRIQRWDYKQIDNPSMSGRMHISHPFFPPSVETLLILGWNCSSKVRSWLFASLVWALPLERTKQWESWLGMLWNRTGEYESKSEPPWNQEIPHVFNLSAKKIHWTFFFSNSTV